MKLKELIQKIEKDPKNKDLLVDSYLDDFIPNQLLKSETLQSAFAITTSEMETLYKQGFEFYQESDYQNAFQVFRWLVILDTLEKKYWFCLGAVQKMLKEYENALKSFAMVTLLDDKDPSPHFHAYECYLMLNNAKEAKKALQLYESLKL